MNLTDKYLHSKWTSLKAINGWRHYEVKNVYVEHKKLELFSVCDKSIIEVINIKEINNKVLWASGWKK